MKRASALAALCAAATAALAAPPSPQPFSLALEPGRVHEECVRLEAGEERRWHWKSDAPVDFNIHYHRGDAVTYPVRRSAMRGDGGTFKAKTAEDYCWMWTAKGARATLEGRIDPK